MQCPEPQDQRWACEYAKIPLGWQIVFTKLHAVAEVKKISITKESIKGELFFYVSWDGERKVIYNGNFNFTSQTKARELIKELSESFPEYKENLDFKGWIQYFREVVLYLARQGEPVIEFNTDISEAKYLVYPFIVERMPNLIYATGGSGKTIFACILALSYVTGKIGPIEAQDTGKVLYLDYENCQNIIFKRVKEIALSYNVSFDVIRENFKYRSCRNPFKEDVENILKILEDYPAELIIIDSIGIASGGNMKEDTVANEFFLALRSIPATPLLITHIAKHDENKHPFGSVYFFNYARNAWFFTTKNLPDKIRIIAEHTKSNLDKKAPPMPFNILFEDGRVIIEKSVLQKETDGESMSTKQLITEWLKDGPKTAYELADLMGENPSYIRTALNRLEKEGMVVRLHDKTGRSGKVLWALRAEEPF